VWKLIVLAVALGAAAFFLLAPQPGDGVVLADGAEMGAGDRLVMAADPTPTIYATNLDILEFADMHIGVGYLPWFDEAALKVLQTPSNGAWSLRAVIEGLGARVDELEG